MVVAATRPKAKATASARKALEKYEAKRDFKKTSEPDSKPSKANAKSGNRFVVQKHDARRLHFDLRLELGGVLKSWAVTKGPSMTPGIRRLAVETEDHPLGYLNWEGVIPKGQYGGGTMIVWDQGTWETEGDAAKALKDGKISITLKGQRLKGHWALVRMQPEGKKHNWLLIKGKDEFALKPGEEEPALTEMTSLQTGLANHELTTAKDIRPDHRVRAAKASADLASTPILKKIPGAKGGILPVFVEPSLAMSVTEPPHGKTWLHEIKHDGYRIQARLEGGKVKLLTRKGLDWTSKFPPIAARLADMPVGSALIDGEIIVQDASGQSSFSGLQDDLKAKRYDRLAYYAFDLLHCNGIDLRGVKLTDRKEILKQLIEATPKSFALRFSDYLDEQDGTNLLGQACKLGLEGIVSKRIDLPYVSGRGEHWQKSKCTLRQEFVIVGFVPSTAQPRAVGSLVLGYYEDGKLRHAGRAGTGLDTREAASLGEKLEKLRGPKPEFAEEPTPLSKKGVKWVRPELAAEIEYRGWSSQGLLRQAAILGLREDKPAGEVALERPKAPVEDPKPATEKPSRAKKTTASTTGNPVSSAVKLTHPEKELWADVGVTKQMLVDYYKLVADRCLVEVAGRPLALLRCPDGTNGQCFFAKHAWMGSSDDIHSVDAGGEKPMLEISDFDGLVSLVQMNVLEIHTWGSRTAKLETPDRMIFDLDPDEGVSWELLRSAAIEVKDSLAKIKLDWDKVKDFSKAFASLMVEDSPEKYIAVMSKARRKGKIFIDYLRNGRGATAIAPYSTRARPGAPVAMPLAWKDIKGERPVFRVKDILKAGKLPADPWAGMAALKQKLPL
jgi:bifunctional non-homologous end joining protein LigD